MKTMAGALSLTLSLVVIVFAVHWTAEYLVVNSDDPDVRRLALQVSNLVWFLTGRFFSG
jgi:uncharacterized membrane protein YphA (DoxX/SURF4 family)